MNQSKINFEFFKILKIHGESLETFICRKLSEETIEGKIFTTYLRIGGEYSWELKNSIKTEVLEDAEIREITQQEFLDKITQNTETAKKEAQSHKETVKRYEEIILANEKLMKDFEGQEK